MSELTTVARPYAKAAFEFAVEQNTLDSWTEMLTFAAAVASNNDMKQFLGGSNYAEKAAEVFIGVCGEQLNEQGQNFIKVLAENGRLLALPEVKHIFSEMYADYKKEITVDVTSATELSATQSDKLTQALEKRLARKVKLNCSVNESVLGGMVIKAGDVVIDGSIRGKLDRLAESLQS